MQIEAQQAAQQMVEIAPKTESRRIKKHGGKRPGAGRKPNPTKLLRGVSKEVLADAVADIDIAAVVADLLRSKREVIRLQALNFLYNRMLGKPKQDVTVAGGIVHAHTRDPFLASLPREALEMLARSYDEVVAKYTLPAPQDGPQNQVESTTAIEAEIVESEASNA